MDSHIFPARVFTLGAEDMVSTNRGVPVAHARERLYYISNPWSGWVTMMVKWRYFMNR